MIQMLIVDDEPLILESLANLVDWGSIGVTVAGKSDNGAAAMDFAFKHKPDIILSDVSMPLVGGLGMLETLRKNNMDVEVIFLSAHGKFEYAQEALKYGAFDYVLKPVDERLLLETVSRCAEKVLSKRGGAAEDAPAEPYDSSAQLAARAVSFIQENFQKDISLSQLSERLYVSPAHLSRIFSAETKTPFSQYLRNLRIETAKRLLREGRLKIYEVAERVGYSDVAHFSKTFKLLVGVTPIKFRETWRAGKNKP